MQAFVLTQIRQGEIREVPDPPPVGPREVLLQIASVGVCGSDLHYFRTGRIGSQIVEYPFIVGHECSGVVLETGSAVTRLSPGDRVAVDPSVSCGECDQCRAGREHTCRRNRFLGCPGQLSGALADRIVMPQQCLFPIPDSMTWEQAVMSEPLAIAVYAAKTFVDIKNKAVGILGSGPIGLCIQEVARHYGARSIHTTDLLAYRQDAARGNGATWAGAPSELEAAIHDHEPEGLDVVFECCGSQEAVKQAFAIMKPGGSLLMIGIPEVDHLEIPIHEARRREVRFFNVRRQVGCVEEALRLIADGSVDVVSMITHHFPLHECRRAFDTVEAYAGGAIKAMIHLDPQRA